MYFSKTIKNPLKTFKNRHVRRWLMVKERLSKLVNMLSEFRVGFKMDEVMIILIELLLSFCVAPIHILSCICLVRVVL